MKTVGIMLSSVKLETVENNPEATQTIFVWMAFVIIVILTYKVGVRFNIWGSVGVSERKNEKTASYSSSEQKGKRFSLGAAVGILAGLAFLALTALLALMAWHEFEFGLSNAPERFAARGYVPREQVAAALAAAAPTLREVHTVTAPPLGEDGVTNWSETVIRDESLRFYLFVPDALTNWVERRVDGVRMNFLAAVQGRRHEFRSLTNYSITVKWFHSARRLAPEELEKMN